MAPLVGRGKVIGGVYFLREKQDLAFFDREMLQVSALCHHLSVQFATLQLPSQAAVAKGLTPRELDIAEIVAQGLTNREIAARLYISHDAVKQALKRIFRKLGVSARLAMVAKISKTQN